jgi:CubicO group peptidase (beta-lactamase class C family)
MRRLVLAPLALVAVLALAAPAPAAAPPTNRQLGKQIKTLQAQVKALQKQVRDARLIALGALVYSGCSVAVTADAFQNTWAVIDEVSNRAPPPKTWFGPQQPVNDFETCRAYQVTRAPTQVPPTVSVFSSLLNLFR